jgi:LPS-assembly lipoprotein
MWCFNVQTRRRFAVHNLGGAGLALGLSACGFQLRQAPKLAFASVYVIADDGLFADELRRTLASMPDLRVFLEAKDQPSAQAILDVITQQREKTVVGVNAAGQVREFQLRVRVKFRLRTPAAKVLIADTELVQQRDISFNESAVLAKEVEEGLLYRDMQTDIVQQLIRRLGAVAEL